MHFQAIEAQEKLEDESLEATKLEVSLELSETKSGPEVFMCAFLLVSTLIFTYSVVCIVRFTSEVRKKVDVSLQPK